jgi:hypothetical protein
MQLSQAEVRTRTEKLRTLGALYSPLASQAHLFATVPALTLASAYPTDHSSPHSVPSRTPFMSFDLAEGRLSLDSRFATAG